MKFYHWIKCRISARHRAAWLYRRGMVRAKLRKHEAAIADYSAVVEMAEVPGDIRAMALYNRALALHALTNDADAINDLRRILELADAPADVKTEARRKLVRMERSSTRSDPRDPTAESRTQPLTTRERDKSR